jgi:[calcium/calmodulin-dependent protein kinase] kinase
MQQAPSPAEAPSIKEQVVEVGAKEARQLSTQSLPSPRIAIHEDKSKPSLERPAFSPLLSAPAATTQFQSPMRHHKRTPSQHREVKETLNARTEYTSDENEGTQHRINQYVIGAQIGRGSYGAVHLATDQFGNEFAVKEFSKARLRKRAQSNILRRPQGGGFGRPGLYAPGHGPWSSHKRQLSYQEEAEAKDALHLIRAEIAIMKKLNHQNLVSLIEVLDDPEEDSLYMVLEMCKKGVVMKVGLGENADPYDEELCRHWFRDLILGIEYLHAQGVVHRDIKPDNLLLTSDDILKIVDFGVSEMFEKPEEMITKKAAGSPAFLPPELCVARHGEVSGKAADVWSMGVSLYCLKYGQLPFQREGVLDMYEAIRTEELPVPENESEHFSDLITRILDKNPDTRITIAEIRDHPWVTKNGTDPLLSEEKNCEYLVEPPNELELNHAVTRKMTNLFSVVRIPFPPRTRILVLAEQLCR